MVIYNRTNQFLYIDGVSIEAHSSKYFSNIVDKTTFEYLKSLKDIIVFDNNIKNAPKTDYKDKNNTINNIDYNADIALNKSKKTNKKSTTKNNLGDEDIDA